MRKFFIHFKKFNFFLIYKLFIWYIIAKYKNNIKSNFFSKILKFKDIFLKKFYNNKYNNNIYFNII